uniref:Uncharacterized protein n=1 Tax=Arundo donax TaxID=35708 RepID=A0A0A9BK14_ARUDO
MAARAARPSSSTPRRRR